MIALGSLLTLLFAVVLSAPVDYLARRGLRRGWGLLAVALGLLLVLQLALIATDPLVSQAQGLAADFPALLARAQALVEGLPFRLGGFLGPLLELDRLIGFLQGSGLSVATVLGWGSSAANLIALGIVVVLTGASGWRERQCWPAHSPSALPWCGSPISAWTGCSATG